jgi:Rrf2 family protein
MRVPVKTDYAIRALVELAGHVDDDAWLSAERIAQAQNIPTRFLLNILTDLRRAGMVKSQRGVDGGYKLVREAWAIPLADVIRVIDGPLASIGDLRPEQLEYPENTAHLQDLWVAVRASLRNVLERVTIDDLAKGKLPAPVARLTSSEDSWTAR